MLLRMAQSGQLRGRVSEPQLVDLLDQVEAAEAGGRPGAGSTDKSKIIVRLFPLISSSLLQPVCPSYRKY